MSIIMGAVKPLDKQINDYLLQLNDKQKRAVLTVVKTFVEEQENEPTLKNCKIFELMAYTIRWLEETSLLNCCFMKVSEDYTILTVFLIVHGVLLISI